MPVLSPQVPAKAMKLIYLMTHPMLLRILFVLYMAAYVGMIDAIAQRSTSEDRLVKITGKITCVNPINGAMSMVVIYNSTRDDVAISQQDGYFEIYMGRFDTVTFSSPEHLDYVFSFIDDSEFKDQSINVIMKTDAIWLNTVTIIGLPSVENFKQAILNGQIESDNPELILPEIDKYIRQNITGNGEFDLKGPFTYLHEKFARYHKLKRRGSQ